MYTHKHTHTFAHTDISSIYNPAPYKDALANDGLYIGWLPTW